MPLIKNGASVADPFENVADDDALPANGAIVSLARFQRDRATLLERNAPLGVRLSADQSPERLGEDLHHLSVVVLEFPSFRDGRAFSWARMLRERLRYRGEIRATGDFLYDQLAFLLRVGFDAFQVRENFTPEMFARAQAEIAQVYQPSADGRATIAQLRRQHTA